MRSRRGGGASYESRAGPNAVEVDEVLEAVCESLEADEVTQILDLEEAGAIEAASVDLSDFVVAMESWPKDDETLWSTLTSERLRTVLAAVMVAAAKGKHEDLGACVAFCEMASVAGAPASVASPGVLRCVARAMEAPASETTKPSRVPAARKRRAESAASSSSASSRSPSSPSSRTRRKDKKQYGPRDLFAAFCRCATSEEWPRLQAELERTEHGDLVTRLASIAAKKLAQADDPRAGAALGALVGEGGPALEALLDPLFTSAHFVKRAMTHAALKSVPLEALLGLRQRLCLRAAGANASTRQRVARVVVALGEGKGDREPNEDREPQDDSAFAAFARKLSLASQAKYRAFAVEVLANFRGEEEAIEARVLDRAPAVRARALAALERLEHDAARLFADRASHDDKAQVRARALKCLEKKCPSSSSSPTRGGVALEAASAAAEAANSNEPQASVRLAGVSLLAAWFSQQQNNDDEGSLAAAAAAAKEHWPASVLGRANDRSPAVAARVADAVDHWLVRLVRQDPEDRDAWDVADAVARKDRHRRALRCALRNAVASKKKPLFLDRQSGGGLERIVTCLAAKATSTALILLEDFLDAAAASSESSSETRREQLLDATVLRSLALGHVGDDGACAATLRVAAKLGVVATVDDSVDILAVGPETALALARNRAPKDDAWARRILRGQTTTTSLTTLTAPAVRAIGAILAYASDAVRRDEGHQLAVEKLVELCDDPGVAALVRREAFSALGRACAASGALAKENARRFAREIHVGKDASVRCTCCCVLAELCVEHAAYAEPRISALARAATVDPDAVVRRHAIVLLGRLVARDFVKWRSDLAHRVFAAVADPDKTTATLTENCVVDVLLPKHPTLVVNNLVATVFVLNGARVSAEDDLKLRRAAHAAFAGLGRDAKDDDRDDHRDHEENAATVRSFETDLGARFAGPENASKRRKVYATLLAATADEGKIQVAAKLAKDVLANAADDLLGDLRNDGAKPAAAILADALHLLTSDLAVKGSSQKNNRDDDLEDDDDDDIDAATQQQQQQRVPAALVAAKGRLLSRMSKRHLLEQILPILIALKATLERHKSPLLAAVMATLKDIVRRYGSDVDDVLQEDPHLAEELKYDLERAEKNNKKNKRQPHQQPPQRRRRKSSGSLG